MSNSPFDPSKFIAPKAKPLPVILLLDVSGSMSGEKIRNLNDAVRDMLNAFSDTENGEIEIHVAIITFGSQVTLQQPLASASTIQWHDLSAGGMTPLGMALQMAKAMIEDKNVVPSRAYRPTVILVSDGAPNDEWKRPLDAFIGEGRSSKCDRMAMAIGADADETVLGQFIEGTPNRLFYAENANQLRDFFKFVTMSVTARTKSQTPNIIPEASTIGVQPATIESRQDKKTFMIQSSSAEDEGYW
nr:VWA domain-containing protein [Acetobacter persici]